MGVPWRAREAAGELLELLDARAERRDGREAARRRSGVVVGVVGVAELLEVTEAAVHRREVVRQVLGQEQMRRHDAEVGPQPRQSAPERFALGRLAGTQPHRAQVRGGLPHVERVAAAKEGEEVPRMAGEDRCLARLRPGGREHRRHRLGGVVRHRVGVAVPVRVRRKPGEVGKPS
jgi:hypothetical protein